MTDSAEEHMVTSMPSFYNYKPVLPDVSATILGISDRHESLFTNVNSQVRRNSRSRG